MKFNILKTRKGKLKAKLESNMLASDEEIELILSAVDEYEKDNLDTIDKLRRERHVDTKKINGALRQSINAHGPITMLLIGSATKRIVGSMMDNKPKETWFTKLKKWLK